MAKNDIIEKLKRRMMKLPITEEEGAMWVLIEVRKIMDQDTDLYQTFPTLGFYVNWVAHHELERNRYSKAFLNDVMPILTLDGNHTPAQQQVFDSLLTLRSFRDELRRFFTTHGISDAICADADTWSKFVDAYTLVVEGSPIKLKTVAPPSGPLNLSVVSLTVSAVTGAFADSRPYPMDWLIEYADGRKAQLSFSQHGLLGATLAFI